MQSDGPMKHVSLAVMSLYLLATGLVQAAEVECAVLSEQTWAQFAPQGKEVDAIYGDLAIQNSHLKAVIAKPVAGRHCNLKYKEAGGLLIDLADRQAESDQWGAFYINESRLAFRHAQVLVDDKPVELTEPVKGKSITIRVSTDSLTDPASASDTRLRLTVDYVLEADSKALKIVKTFHNPTSEKREVKLSDTLQMSFGKEWTVRHADGTDSSYWLYDWFWKQAYVVSTVPGLEQQLRLDDSAAKVVIQTLDEKDSSNVPLAAKAKHVSMLQVYVGENLNLAKADHARDHGMPLGKIRYHVVDASENPLPGTYIEFYSPQKQLLAAGMTDGSGALEVQLPPGEYSPQLRRLGQKTNGASIGVVASEAKVTEHTLIWKNYRLGVLQPVVVDQNGKALPCKLQLTGIGETPTPDFGPDSAITGVRNVQYLAHGTGMIALPTGKYEVLISRGPEYDAIAKQITISEGKSTALKTTLPRVVQTPGWVSVDYHSHSSPSGDNSSHQAGRVLNLVCEQIDFAPCTEHNRISTYNDHLRQFGLVNEMATCSGMELTGRPLPLNHQNTFPLIHKPFTQNGGGPNTDDDVEVQFERLFLWDGRSEKLIQQDHPDLGWFFFDRNGDRFPDTGYEKAFPMIDVIEIHPITPLIEYLNNGFVENKAYNSQRLVQWLQLLNQGYRIAGIANTDSHYNFHGSGGLRSWVKCSTDDPAKIGTMEMVANSKAGNLIVSNGPYLEFEVLSEQQSQPAYAGQDLVARSGKVTVRLKVQCPNWININRVGVLVNGRVHSVADFRQKEHPELFTSEVVRFEKTLVLDLKEDSHLIAYTVGEGERLGDPLGPSWGRSAPVAMSNPVYVDLDGEGFEPNGDWLDLPKPVKQ